MMAQSTGSVLRLCHAYAFSFLLFSYIFFVIVGALTFMALQQPEWNLLAAEVRDVRARILESHHCVKDSSLEQLLKKALFSGRRGVAVLKADSAKYNFDFTSSLFFVTTLVTTTGYGTTVPLSDEGRVFCMLYCLFGIPLTFLLLSTVTNALVPRVIHAPIRHLHICWGLSHNTAGLLYCGIITICTATLFFLLPALALCLLERDWSFLEALYYCFISLSTIGLGDYLPGRTHSQVARQALEFATSCYLVLGLVVMLVVMESFRQLQQVQALVRFFAGPYATEQEVDDFDEFSEGPDINSTPGDDAHYTSSISIISHSLSDVPITCFFEETFT